MATKQVKLVEWQAYQTEYGYEYRFGKSWTSSEKLAIARVRKEWKREVHKDRFFFLMQVSTGRRVNVPTPHSRAGGGKVYG